MFATEVARTFSSLLLRGGGLDPGFFSNFFCARGCTRAIGLEGFWAGSGVTFGPWRFGLVFLIRGWVL